MTREEAKKILKEDGCGYCTWQSTNPYECENKECKVKEALEMAIKALENHDTFMKYAYSQGKVDALSQEPCDDAISREELLKAIDTWDKFGVDDTNSLFRLDNLSLPHYVPYIHYDDVIKCIKGMPPVTQKSGKWQVVSDGYGDSAYICECSECKDTVWVYKNADRKWKYCPHCGARMESEE